MSQNSMWKKKLSNLISSIIITSNIGIPVQAQIPNINQNFNEGINQLLRPNGDNTSESRCILLDGRCLFNVAPLDSDFSGRIKEIESRLSDVTNSYFRSESNDLEIWSEDLGNLQNIYVKINDNQIRLLTVTEADAAVNRLSLEVKTEEIIEQLRRGLTQAKQERQLDSLLVQAGIAVGTLAAMFLVSLFLAHIERKLKISQAKFDPQEGIPGQPLTTQLTLRQKWHVASVQHLLIQIAQGGVWLGGTLFILGLFPHTRVVQMLILWGLKYPLRVGITGLSSYVAIRLSYSLIDNFSSSLASNYVLTGEANQRLKLRITTISGVTKSIITVTGVIVGILVSLAVIGLNIAPLLAGAGIIGFAISLGSQNLIRDAINGFCIIVEDQYAVGDVINVEGFGGLVESMNLRITRLRDGEGRLITIPNSEIRIVANLSSEWSRADLNIPIAYQTDVDEALAIIGQVAEKMNNDPSWSDRILEAPLVLGVDLFGDRGVIIKVWIKTQPLKQWEVSREFRRRVKTALDQAGIPIPPPQQEIQLSRK
jgi:small conductance mechanosensitive channel